MSKQQPRNENPPIPHHEKISARIGQSDQTPNETGPQSPSSASASPPSDLTPWRQSLDASKRLSADLDRLGLIRTGLASESATLNLEIVKVCDTGIAEPARRTELAVELSRLCARHVVLEHEQAGVNRGLDKTIGELQKTLLDGSYGWPVLAQRYQDHVLERKTRELLSGVQTPNQQMQEGALALAKGDPEVVDAGKFSAVSQVSFAWSQAVTEKSRDSILEHLRTVVVAHIRLAEPLLAAAATLTSLPVFEEPPAPPSESVPLAWLEPIDADQSLVDRLIEASGKKREELSEADLAILTRSASGNNSYLREIKDPADRLAVGST